MFSKIVDGLLLVTAGIALWVLFGATSPDREAATATPWVTSEAVLEMWDELTDTEAVLGRGGDTGPVIIELSDYQCPFCRQSHAVVQRLLEEDPDVTVFLRHLPLRGLHPAAEGAALAAICAGRQGHFEEMHDVLMEYEDWLEEGWEWAAKLAGLPELGEFATCLGSDGARADLQRDEDLARRLGVGGTPVFLGRRGVHEGAALDVAVLRRLFGDGS